MVCNACRKSEVINSQRSIFSFTLHLEGTHMKCDGSMNQRVICPRKESSEKRKIQYSPKIKPTKNLKYPKYKTSLKDSLLF